MFCKNCGTELKDGASFCPRCGTPVSQRANPDGVQAREGWPKSGISWRGARGGGNGAAAGGFQMHWHQFVTTVGLLGTAVVYLVFAIRTILGSAYLDQSIRMTRSMARDQGFSLPKAAVSQIKDAFSVKDVWDSMGSLKGVDILIIICWFAMLVAAFFIRQQLVQYKRNAPRYFTIYIVAGGGIYFLHSLVRQIICNAEAEMSGVHFNFMVVPVIGLILAVAAAYLNHIYYVRRAALFCR